MLVSRCRFISVFARIEKGQGADLWKGHFLCAVYRFEGTVTRDFTFWGHFYA